MFPITMSPKKLRFFFGLVPFPLFVNTHPKKPSQVSVLAFSHLVYPIEKIFFESKRVLVHFLIFFFFFFHTFKGIKKGSFCQTKEIY